MKRARLHKLLDRNFDRKSPLSRSDTRGNGIGFEKCAHKARRQLVFLGAKHLPVAHVTRLPLDPFAFLLRHSLSVADVMGRCKQRRGLWQGDAAHQRPRSRIGAKRRNVRARIARPRETRTVGTCGDLVVCRSAGVRAGPGRETGEPKRSGCMFRDRAPTPEVCSCDFSFQLPHAKHITSKRANQAKL